MRKLKNEEIAILNCYVYMLIPNKDNQSLYKAITDLEKKPILYNKMLKTDAGSINDESKINILNLIKTNPKLSNLIIARNNMYEPNYDIDGMKVICFLDIKSKEALFIYRGTNSGEWLDNAIGFYTSESPQQIEAKEYLENTCDDLNLCDKKYDIITSGHSKGGNKAMYTAITSNLVDRCVAFDGQGFSYEFLDKYKELIDKNSCKIQLIATEKDYVHCLGNCIVYPKNISWHKSNKGNLPLVSKALAHCPDAYLNKDGSFTKKASHPSKTYEDIKKLTLALMKAPNKESYFNAAMGALQLYLAKTTSLIKREKMPHAEEISNGLTNAMKFLSSEEFKTINVNLIQQALQIPYLDKLLTKINIYQEQKLNKNINPETVQKISHTFPLVSHSKVAIFEEKNKVGEGFIGELVDGKIHKLCETQSLPYIKSLFKDLLQNNIDSKECINEFILNKHSLEQELLINYNMKYSLQKLKSTNENSILKEEYKILLKEINLEIANLEKKFKTAPQNIQYFENYYTNKISYIKLLTNDLSQRNPILDKEINEICLKNLGILSFEKILIYEQINNTLLMKNTSEKFYISKYPKETNLQLSELRNNIFNPKIKSNIANIIDIILKDPSSDNLAYEIHEINSIYTVYKELQVASSKTSDENLKVLSQKNSLETQKLLLYKLIPSAENLDKNYNIYQRYLKVKFFKKSFEKKYYTEIKSYENSKKELSNYGFENKFELNKKINEIEKKLLSLPQFKEKANLNLFKIQSRLNNKINKLHHILLSKDKPSMSITEKNFTRC